MLRYFSIVPIIVAVLFCPYSHADTREYLVTGRNTTQRIYYSTSSDFSKNHNGSMALDNDTRTSWVSEQGSGPHWIVIDFGVKRIMTSLVIIPGKRHNHRTLKRLTLQFLYRGEWIDHTEVELERPARFGRTRYLKQVEIDLGGIDASTFRIFIPENGTCSGIAAISEIWTRVGTSRITWFDERLRGMCYPVRNGFLPVSDYSYPGAPRSYRGGTHAGLDIFHYYAEGSYVPVPVDRNTEILAAKKGVVIRADLEYRPMTPAEWKQRSEYYRKNVRTYVARSFGGRQVWIDHGNGIVTTYNHLSRIDPAVKKGCMVYRGQRIGWAGNSGLLGEAEGNDRGVHLHFEIWIDSYYLGYGMKTEDIRKYIRWIFFPRQ